MHPDIKIDKFRIRSFGRINGRKLRPAQEGFVNGLLPVLRVDVDNLSLEKLFPRPGKLWIEIGFGYGEHINGMAQKYPDVNFIGCEPFLNGVATLLKHIDESRVENIRILHGDARLLIEKLPENSVDRAFILFPDPWPKTKHHKKRIISSESLKSLARVLVKGGRLDIATDHVEYGNWIAAHLGESAEFAVNNALGDGVPEDWIETRYQQKALKEGRGARFFNYVKV